MNDSLHLCACGCGSRTRRDDRGRPRLFLRGHNRRAVGRGWIEAGYRYVSRGGRKIPLHRLIVEEREGRRLSSNEVVHHVDRNPLNNDPDNLSCSVAQSISACTPLEQSASAGHVKSSVARKS